MNVLKIGKNGTRGTCEKNQERMRGLSCQNVCLRKSGCDCLKWPYHERRLGRILWLSEDEKSAGQQDDADDAGHRYDPRFLFVQSRQPFSQDDAEPDQTHNWGKGKMELEIEPRQLAVDVKSCTSILLRFQWKMFSGGLLHQFATNLQPFVAFFCCFSFCPAW